MDGLFTGTKYSDNGIGYRKGSEYEKFVVDNWSSVYPGRTLSLRQGQAGQLSGETKEGIEIKFDDMIFFYCKSGRLYIETHEKAKAENKEYVRSGIYREDNTTIYLIGDYDIWFLFSKQKLRWLEKLDPPFLFLPKSTPTSKGFCIPLKNAKILCLDYQEF